MTLTPRWWTQMIFDGVRGGLAASLSTTSQDDPPAGPAGDGSILRSCEGSISARRPTLGRHTSLQVMRRYSMAVILIVPALASAAADL
jgi:hypothetical protein